MNKPLTAINRKLDEFIRSIERLKGRSEFIEGLRNQGFEGTDEQILEDHAWLMAPRGASSYQVPKEPEQADDDEEEGDSE